MNTDERVLREWADKHSKPGQNLHILLSAGASRIAELEAQVEELKARIVDIHAERIQAALEHNNG